MARPRQITPARLRQRVTLQTKTATRSASGAEVPTWTDTVTVWASVEDLNGREFWGSRKVNAEATAIITIRHRLSVVTTMRAVFGSRTFDILTAYDPDNKRRELHMECRELI